MESFQDPACAEQAQAQPSTSTQAAQKRGRGRPRQIRIPFRPTTDPAGAMRLPVVLQTLGISKTHWYRGIREGRFPQGHKLGRQLTVWAAQDIYSIARGAK